MTVPADPSAAPALDPRIDEPAAPQRLEAARPRPALLALGLLGTLFTAVTLAFAITYTGGYLTNRFGESAYERQRSLRGVPQFQRDFLRFVELLQRALPPGTKVLVEAKEATTISGQARWYLYLTYAAYPVRVYVRRPELASGTLVDYPRWLNREIKTPSIDDRLRLIEEVDALEIEYRLRYVAHKRFQIDQLEIAKRVDGQWVDLTLQELLGESLRGEEPDEDEVDIYGEDDPAGTAFREGRSGPR
jgi:hypothetical protein